ncbi:hypothetical protein ND16A_0404 [Thalassotalea sp. ND16A]|nr:hypothetical protein ND16A_0404 [Thalassotalea sp. ND16A]
MLLIGCTPNEFTAAKRSYEQAKSTQQLIPLTVSLKQLAHFKPELYLAELTTANSANIKFQLAKKYLEQKNYYQAFMSSHDSNLMIDSVESKHILKEAGRVLLPFAKAYANIKKSSKLLPSSLFNLLIDHQSIPADKWNLIELNHLFAQLNESRNILIISINEINSIDMSSLGSLSEQVVSWKSDISNQVQYYQQAQEYLSELARFKCASALNVSNLKLAEQTSSILLVFRSKKIKKAIKPFFNQAKIEYAACKQLIENISLVSTFSGYKIHSSWFPNWRKVESSILEPVEPISAYPLQVKQRGQQLQSYLIEPEISKPTALENIHDVNGFSSHYGSIVNLIDKLKVHR